MGESLHEDELDRKLRDAAPYIDDAGFTTRVLQQLPQQSAPARARGVILIATAVLASVLAYFVSGGGRFLRDFVVQLSETPLTSLLALLFTLGLVIGALGLAAAIFKSREPGLLAR